MLAEQGAHVNLIECGEGASLFVRRRNSGAVVLDLTAPDPNGAQWRRYAGPPGRDPVHRAVIVMGYRCGRERVAVLVTYVTKSFCREEIQAVADEILSPRVSRGVA